MGSFDRPLNPDEKFIFDVDTGPDDALAIFLALRNEKYKNGPPLIAITCVHGATTLSNSVLNTLKTLARANRRDIPVHIGANMPIMEVPFVKYGPGDASFPNFDNFIWDLPEPSEEYAPDALVRLVNLYPGDITLFSMGPLTNIAHAVEMDPHFILKLNKLIINGGDIVGFRDILPDVEFSFYLDPHALSIVLAASIYTRVTVTVWDPSLPNVIPLSWRRHVFGALERSDIRFMNHAEILTGDDDNDTWRAPNTLAFAMHICPFILEKIEPACLVVITEDIGRGTLFINQSILADMSNCNVCTVIEFDLDEFQSQMLHYFEYD